MEDNTKQLLIQDVIEKVNVNENVILNGSVNGGRKPNENLQKTFGISSAISRLKDYKNHPTYKETAQCLERLFGVWLDQPHHWDYIAEYYTLKAINREINGLIKRKQNGGMPIINKGAYLTSNLVNFHRKRKIKKRKIFGETKRQKAKREKELRDQLNRKSNF